MNIETDLPSRRVNGRMWVAGQSGNPAAVRSVRAVASHSNLLRTCERRGNGTVQWSWIASRSNIRIATLA